PVEGEMMMAITVFFKTFGLAYLIGGMFGWTETQVTQRSLRGSSRGCPKESAARRTGLKKS
ncbi:hypothetical protein GALMADRAFT_246058, partial [Galerina marginata CBS 339.88]